MTFTITGDVATLLGVDHSPGDPVALWVECSQPIMTVDGEGRLGGRLRVDVASDGTFEVADLPASVDDIPLYRLVIDSRSLRQTGTRGGITTGWFPLTADRDLTWIIANYVTTETVSAALATDIRAAAALGATNDTATASFVANAASATATALVENLGRRGVLLADYPRQGAETHDSARLTRAIAAAVANGSRTVIIPAATYTLGSTVTISDANVRLVGLGWQTTLATNSDIIGLEITGEAVELHDLVISTPQSNRTVFPVRVTGASRPYFNHIFFAGQTDSYRSGVFLNGGSEARLEACLFNHACARVETYDVKFDSCYIWAMTCEWGIYLGGSAGNLTINNCDFVPPLRSLGTGKAGIYINAGLQVKIIGCYLDGNGGLQTREGIIINDGVGQVLIQGVTSNNMASDCIVIDSAYNVLIDGYSGYSNNRHANNSREIVVKQTGAQPIQNVRITNAQFLQTQAVQDGGVAQAAVAVLSPVDGAEVSIEGFDVKQPGAGGGYANPEIVCDAAKTSLSGRGTLSKYSAIGSQAVASGATGTTITLSTPYPMAYRPKASDIHLEMEGDNFPAHRIQFNSDNQIFVGWATALGGAATIHWKVDLRR